MATKNLTVDVLVDMRRVIRRIKAATMLTRMGLHALACRMLDGTEVPVQVGKRRVILGTLRAEYGKTLRIDR